MTIRKADKIIYDQKMSEYYNIVGKDYSCKKCNHIINASREKHYKRCVGYGSREETKDFLKQNQLAPEYYSKLCDMGCGNNAQFFYKNGKGYCCKLGAKCPVKVEKDRELKKGINPFEGKEHPRGSLGMTPWNKGLTKNTHPMIKQQMETYRINFQIHGGGRKEFSHTEETKLRIKEILHQRYASGWQSTSCGRAKSYEHTSPTAGKVHLTGTWEVAFAQILDQLNIVWEHPKKRFDYVKPDGVAATYLPDFYVPSWNHSYVEVKGYETDLDRCKWNQFPEKLVVIRRKEIETIKSWLQDERIVLKEDMFIKLLEIK